MLFLTNTANSCHKANAGIGVIFCNNLLFLYRITLNEAKCDRTINAFFQSP